MVAEKTAHADDQIEAYDLSPHEIEKIVKEEGGPSLLLTDWESGGAYHFNTLRVSESEINGAGRYIISLVEQRESESRILSIHAVPEKFAGRVQEQSSAVDPVQMLKGFASKFGSTVHVGNERGKSFFGRGLPQGFEVDGEGDVLSEYLTAPQEAEKGVPEGARFIRVLLATAIDTAAVREHLGPR